MDKEEILSCLEILKFDRYKHTSIKEAFTTLIKEERFTPILNGVITNSEVAEVLRNIIEA